MSNTYFQFKQFVVHQQHCAMKVGTDGVLLGSWTVPANANSILDIGTGTGLIALMLAQKSTAHITGIEIDTLACQQATENAAISKWNDRISIRAIALQDFVNQANTFDLIVSNPPYFHNSYKAGSPNRTIARHTDTLTYNELIVCANRLMHSTSVFNVILPFDNLPTFQKLCIDNQLFISKRTDVIPVHGKPAKRVLLSFTKNAENELIYSEIVIETNGRHRYSDEFIVLTKDFYLNL